MLSVPGAGGEEYALFADGALLPNGPAPIPLRAPRIVAGRVSCYQTLPESDVIGRIQPASNPVFWNRHPDSHTALSHRMPDL